MNKPVGLGAQVAESLTIGILEGTFKGGEQLIELELQNYFGVSRSPLREAFRELEKKGLVEIVPRKGTFVKRITRRDIEEHFPVRAALEGLAAELAAHHMTQEHLLVLEREFENMSRGVREVDTQTYYTHHLAFHECFIGACNNKVLIESLKTLRMQNLWHRFSYQYYQEDLNKSLAVHETILNEFRNEKKDPSKCRRLVENHINIALERFLAYLESSGEDK